MPGSNDIFNWILEDSCKVTTLLGVGNSTHCVGDLKRLFLNVYVSVIGTVISDFTLNFKLLLC